MEPTEIKDLEEMQEFIKVMNDNKSQLVREEIFPDVKESIKSQKIRSKEDRTLGIPLTKKQLAIIADNRQQIDHFNNLILLCQQKEQDLITFILEYEHLSMEDIEGVSLGEGKVMVIKNQ